MKFGKKHRDISAMLKANFPKDQEFVKDVEEKIQASLLTNTLAMLRNSRSMTQLQVAQKIGCGQGKISKIEAAEDDDVSFGDIKSFAQATGYDVEIIFRRQGATLVDDIKYYTQRMKSCFDRMAHLSQQDEGAANSITKFCKGALFNLVKLVIDTTKKTPTPHKNKSNTARLSISVEDDCSSDLFTDGVEERSKSELCEV